VESRGARGSGVAGSPGLAPEEGDGEIDYLFEDDDLPDVLDGVVFEPVGGEVRGRDDAVESQEHESDVGDVQHEHPDNMEDVQQEHVDNMEDVQQEHADAVEDVQHPQIEPDGFRFDAHGMTEAPDDEDIAPAIQIPTYENVDDDSLFMPDERVASPDPGLFGRLSPTPSPLNRPSPTSSLFSRLPAAPQFASQPPSSRTGPTAVPASRPGAKSSASLYSKIRGLHKKISRPPQLVQPGSGRETYLDELLAHAPGRQAAGTAEDEHDRADREARAKYQKHKTHYEETRKKNGKLTFAQDVAWMRIRAAETSRLRKTKRDRDMARRENGEDPDLLPDATGSLDGLDDDGLDDDGIEDDPAGSTRTPEPASRRTFPSMVEAELQSMKVALKDDEDKLGRKRKGARVPDDEETGRSRGRARGPKAKASSAASSTRAKAGVRKTAKDKKAAENAARLHTSLMHSDVFRQQASDDAPEQPTFTSRNKQDALKQLIASVPTEHQKSVKDDTAALLRATKDFDGRGSCKADGSGMWKVKGMRTSLKHYQIMGTAFMRRRENDLHEPRGGLMADQMGLGKTLMSKSALHRNPEGCVAHACC
jgi:hypothetical protein